MGAALVAASIRVPSAPAAAVSVPPLAEPAATLTASLACHGNLATSTIGPVLLIPGTTMQNELRLTTQVATSLATAPLLPLEPALRADATA